MTDPKTTPMMEQYLSIKKDYPDAILMYRMGDFFEFFYEDAEIVARELQLALTCRNPHAEQKMPMAGFPHTAALSYVQQLLDKGYIVVKCDQMELPKPGKGLVKREVTRIFTPGTVLEGDCLEADTFNMVAALSWNEGKKYGALCWADVSTGNWSGLEDKKEDNLWQWAMMMEPREIILPEGYNPPRNNLIDGIMINHAPAPAYFDYAAGRDKIKHALSITDLVAVDLEDKDELVKACGALLSHFLQTLRQENLQLKPFKAIVPGKHLILDEVTQRNLEIFKTMDGRKGVGTLKHVLNRTVTPMGGRHLDQMLRTPWMDEDKIKQTHDAVEFLLQNESLRKELRDLLKKVYDLERLYRRIELNQCTPKDFIALRQSLSELPAIRLLLQNAHNSAALPMLIQDVLNIWDDLSECRELLYRSLIDEPPLLFTEGGLFRSGYNQELDELIELTENSKSKLEQLLQEEQSALGLSKLKIGYNRVFGYYFEIPKSMLGKIPYDYERRQSLANAERFSTRKLRELETSLTEADAKRRELEYKLFLELRQQLTTFHTQIMLMAEVLAGIDYWQGLAEAAFQWNWSRPEIFKDGPVIITGGRHPVVESIIGAARFVPNDLKLDDENRIMIITGPNMSGKSTILRQTALICLLAQVGSFVPAEKASLGLIDRIFSRVGASDNLARGQSTFMVEMSETARILQSRGRRSLIILDEIGRGTSTFDGMAIAQAVVEDLAQKNSLNLKVLFATHYLELADLAKTMPGVKNFNVGISEERGEITFMRRLLPGPADKSYGVEVARLAGVPRTVVKRAKELLLAMEQNSKAKLPALSDNPALQPPLPGIEYYHPDNGESNEATMPAWVNELSRLDIESLTPLAALNLLHKWKDHLGE